MPSSRFADNLAAQVAPLSDERDTIVNAVPVWWECRTSVDGAEVENDFDFEEFRCAMIEE